MIFRILLYAFLLYLLYKIVFEFIIPNYKTSQHLKKGFKEAHQRMSEQMNTGRQYSSTFSPKTASPKASTDDYIEFEEIK
jgi:hypothetical protein